ncbi:CHAT domain-containing protein [Streptomyces sp. NPDC001401]|uniref:CHAT domain-containing protein n=1 Tax=Streptomyces sp. NPDC001401 TaxID=3364570 RepID=UPI003692073E
MADEHGVAGLVAAVLNGKVSSSDASRLLEQLPGDPEDASTRWNEVAELIGSIGAEPSVLRATTMIELGEHAARPLGPRAQGVVLLLGSRRLADDRISERVRGFLDRAVAYFAESPELRLTARRLRLQVLRKAGAYEELDREVPSVITEAEQRASRADLCMALFEKAEAAMQRGRAADSLETIRTARHVRECQVDEATVPVIEPYRLAGRHGVIAREAGRFEEALGALEDARTLALAAGDPSYASFALSETGITWGYFGDHERGRQIMEQAAAEAEAAGRPDWAAHWGYRLSAGSAEGNEPEGSPWQRACALLERHPERADEAVPLLRACLKEARSNHDPSYELAARHGLAVALLRTGRTVQAELSFRVAVGAARRLGDQLQEVHCRTNLARCLLVRKRLEEALAEVRPAMELGERLCRRSAAAELRQSIALALGKAYDVAVIIASASYRPSPGMIAAGADPAGFEPRPDTLLEIGQRARAATMTEALRAGRSVEDAGPSELVDAMLRLRAAEAAVQLAAAEHRHLAEAIAEREDSAAALTRQAARSGVRLSVSSDPVPLDELSGSLAPGEVLVDLLTVPEGVAVTCLTSEGSASTTFAHWPQEERMRLLRRLQRTRRELLGAHPDDREEAEEDAARALGVLDASLWSHIASVVGEAGARPPDRIMLTPENELFQAPYWRLASRFPDCAVSVLPTPGALPILRARASDGRRPWVSVADPSSTLRHAARDIPAELGYEACAPRTGALLSALPAAGRVHFACHGHFNALSAFRTGLEVEADAERDPLGAPIPRAADGLELFTAAQITGRLHLPHCALVVLAACDSGLPRLHGASEFTSLPGAFLVAGARNVVASLWPAHDGAAALLMNAFYTAGPEHPSAALASARARLATMSRAEAAERLGTSRLPRGDPPFSDSVYTDCFQHYGVD